MKMSFRPVHAVLAVCSIAIAGVFLSLFGTGPDGSWMLRSYAVWGDWSAHLSLISAFRERGIGWVTGENPLFHGAGFQYPFLSHLLTAGLAEITGCDTLGVTLALSLIFLLALPFLLYRFYRIFRLSRVASLYSCLVFLFLGGFQIFDRTLPESGPVTNQFDSGSVFTQLLLFEFIPQRAFLFGMALVLGLITHMGAARSGPKKTAWIASCLLGVTPLVHLHSWPALGVLLLAFLAFPAPGKSPLASRKSVLSHGLLILALSGPIAAALLLHKHAATASSWEVWFPGWAQNAGAGLPAAAMMNPIWFWLYNTGVFLPLCLFGVFLASRTRSGGATPELRSLGAPGLAGAVLFVIALLFRTQPNFYDNLKIFTWAFLFLAPFAGIALERIQKRFWPAAVAILILQTASAVRDFSFFVSPGQPVTWLESSEVDLAREFKTIRSSADELVLIQPRHNHWVPMLTGNPVVMGYAGWLWSWGIAYRETEQKIDRILLGAPDAAELVRELHPRWIVLDRRTRVRGREIDFDFFDRHYRRVLERDAWVVFSVEDSAK